jgi:hypothetical protein
VYCSTSDLIQALIPSSNVSKNAAFCWTDVGFALTTAFCEDDEHAIVATVATVTAIVFVMPIF